MMGNGINQSRTALPMFANKSLSDFGIPVILSTIYVPKEKIGNMKYIHHRKRGIKVPLHIRELKADRITVGAGAYTFLGTANYVKHDGSRPMNITRQLDRPIPAKFLKKTNKLVV